MQERPRPALADRRRDHFARPHRTADRSGLRHPVVWVKDASRSVDVAANWPAAASRSLRGRHQADYEAYRERAAKGKRRKALISLDQAAPRPPRSRTSRAITPSRRPNRACTSSRTGRWRIWSISSTGPRFSAPGSWPAATPTSWTTQSVGEAATSLFEDARKMLDQIVAEKWLTAKAVCACGRPPATGDDVLLYTDESRRD
jgi:5-methyltetrahydrofolate--homocysteine methyltransferase